MYRSLYFDCIIIGTYFVATQCIFGAKAFFCYSTFPLPCSTATVNFSNDMKKKVSNAEDIMPPALERTPRTSKPPCSCCIRGQHSSARGRLPPCAIEILRYSDYYCPSVVRTFPSWSFSLLYFPELLALSHSFMAYPSSVHHVHK